MGDDLTTAARRLKIARACLDEAMEAAHEAVVVAHGVDGMPETEIARTLGVNRMTVRRWLGKLP